MSPFDSVSAHREPGFVGGTRYFFHRRVKNVIHCDVHLTVPSIMLSKQISRPQDRLEFSYRCSQTEKFRVEAKRLIPAASTSEEKIHYQASPFGLQNIDQLLLWLSRNVFSNFSDYQAAEKVTDGRTEHSETNDCLASRASVCQIVELDTDGSILFRRRSDSPWSRWKGLFNRCPRSSGRIRVEVAWTLPSDV